MSRYLQVMLNSLLFCLGRIKPLCGPLKVQIEVTHRCNSRCKSCNFWQKKVKDEMTKDEFLEIIEGLNKLGVRRIGIGGGEALTFNGIFDIIKYSKKLGMATSIGTNGLLLERYCSEISDSGLDIIEISLDGGEKVHNINRGIEDAFDKVIRGIKGLLEYSKRPLIQLNFTPNTINVLELLEITKIANELGIEQLSIEPAHPINENLTINEDLFVKEDQAKRFAEMVEEVIKENPHLLTPPHEYYRQIPTFFKDPINPIELPQMRCVAGYNLLVIDPIGDVYACPAKEVVIGNLRQKKITEIWNSSAHLNDLKRIKDGRHKICWLNSVAPINLAYSYILKPSRWGEVFNILKNHSMRF